MRNNQTETFLKTVTTTTKHRSHAQSDTHTSLDYLALSSSAELLSAKRIANHRTFSNYVSMSLWKNKQMCVFTTYTHTYNHSLLYEYAKTNQI